jgi:hypothetical protein
MPTSDIFLRKPRDSAWGLAPSPPRWIAVDRLCEMRQPFFDPSGRDLMPPQLQGGVENLEPFVSDKDIAAPQAPVSADPVVPDKSTERRAEAKKIVGLSEVRG